MELSSFVLLVFCAEALHEEANGDVDVYPEFQGQPGALFGNVYRDGYSPSGLGQTDPLVDLKDVPQRASMKKIQGEFNKRNPNPFKEDLNYKDTNPFKENFSYDFKKQPKNKPQRRLARDTRMSPNNQEARGERALYIDLPERLEMNLRFGPRRNPRRNYQVVDATPPPGLKPMQISPDSFAFPEDQAIEMQPNWTTCEEFAIGAHFHPDDIVKIVWIPVYVWTDMCFSSFRHKFSTPTEKFVREYRQKYGPLLPKVINWGMPKLLMESIGLEMLLVAKDYTGLFYGIQKTNLPEGVYSMNITMPLRLLRMKIEDPYLIYMYCDQKDPCAHLLAILGQGPIEVKDILFEALLINFRGPGAPVPWMLDLERDYLLSKRLEKGEAERSGVEGNDSLLNAQFAVTSATPKLLPPNLVPAGYYDAFKRK